MQQIKSPRILLLNPPYPSISNVVRDLLYVCWCQGKRIAGASFPPLDLLFIAEYLKPKAQVTVLDKNIHAFDPTQLGDFAAKFIFLILASNSGTFDADVSIIRTIKAKAPKIIVILYGSHPTFFPQAVLMVPEIDFAINGEPEFAISSIIDQFSRNPNIRSWKTNEIPPGVACKFHEEVVQSPPVYNNCLDDLPIPDRKILQNVFFFNPLTKSKKWTTALTSRGCPGRCLFCTAPGFYGNRFRFHSVNWMLREVKYLKSLGFDEIFYRDETFTANPQRTIAFCKALIAEQVKIRWIANVRVGTADYSLLKWMKAAGCHTIKIGVESGSQKILDNLNKGISVQATRDLFAHAHTLNLLTHAHLMVGAIGETYESLEDTFKILTEIKPDTATFNLFLPAPGSPIYNQFIHHDAALKSVHYTIKAMLSKPMSDTFYTKLPIAFLNTLVARAYRRFYFRPSYLMNTLKSIKNLDDLIRVLKSGMNIFSFIAEN